MLPDEVRDKAGTKEFIKLVRNLDLWFLFIYLLLLFNLVKTDFNHVVF